MLIIELQKEKMKCLHAYIFAYLICIISIAGHIGYEESQGSKE